MESILAIDGTSNTKAKRFHLLRFEGKAFPMAVSYNKTIRVIVTHSISIILLINSGKSSKGCRREIR